MRAMLVSILSLPVLLLMSFAASADEKPAADPPAPAAESRKIAEFDADADATPRQAAADKDEEFKVPPGFRIKKRGEFTLYCRKEEVMGTRFASEKCYDETGIREMLRAQRENQQNVDRMRRICGQQGACGSN